MFEAGIFVALGLVVWLVKAGWKWRMRIFSNPLAVDLFVFVILVALHWGTFSGVMAATIGALLVSIILTICRFLFGHIDNKRYTPGFFDISAIVRAERLCA